MYKCQQCGEQAEIQGKQDIDINYDTPFISDWVICETCGYTISKDTADKAILLDACKDAKKAIYEAINKRKSNLSVVWHTLEVTITKAEQTI
ncbi:hypothetical protein LCGC14_0783190 [marine sediment metagenome]|uniref:Uncharacterized protein n=1 Tax=marine sediment metagenome TaxID=412755 RepID=A0A0F9QEP4_9ZZZZ